MITSIDFSQEIHTIDLLTALNSFFKHRRKPILRLLRLYGDQGFTSEAEAVAVEPAMEVQNETRQFLIV